MKKTLYPKTERVRAEKVTITEKLDGSNLGIFKLNDEIYFAQRNHILKESELTKQNAYKGLRQWAEDNCDELNHLIEGSCIFGEWIGMGKLKYRLDKRFYMFAKANVSEEFEANRINYNHELFIYPFDDMKIPNCIGVVPIVDEGAVIPTIAELDILYNNRIKLTHRSVEGLVVNFGNGIKKYVRMKNGKLEEHKS